ncbi:MAG TPA: HK97 family phage prohead protease [Kribbellaceae bacterium]|nr:HK97 family phage prohead protease [Kribbellaceae bacterium]
MPLKRCETDGRPGWKWGDEGKCYPYSKGDESSEKAARKKALAQAAAMGEFEGTGHRSAAPEIFHRSRAELPEAVNFKDRTIELVAMPWNVETEILFRSQVWRELFLRGAFNDAIKAGARIPVNREHDHTLTVGRITGMVDHPHGLLASVKIAKTERGDETLELANDGILGGSVGYFLQKMSDVVLDRRAMLRTVKRAFMEHLAMTEIPAYKGADTIAVHSEFSKHPAAGLQPLVTPELDEWTNDPVLQWAKSRLAK